MTGKKRAGTATAGTTTPKVPRYVQFRCDGHTSEGEAVSKTRAMKARVFVRRRNGEPPHATVILYKGRQYGGAKGGFAGIYHSIEELAVLELAARVARSELIALLEQPAG